jgi:hypothetical protein
MRARYFAIEQQLIVPITPQRKTHRQIYSNSVCYIRICRAVDLHLLFMSWLFWPTKTDAPRLPV